MLRPFRFEIVARLLFILATLAALGAAALDILDAPKDIQALSAAIQGKSPAEIRALIGKRFGSSRNVGSGLRIEVWDIPNGVLTFHPVNGPTFFDSKAKKTYWLLRTANPVRVNLLQSYEMTTLPDPANHGSCYWLGNLKFGADMTYQFKDDYEDWRGTRHLIGAGHLGGQAENFFLLHPAGKVRISYAASISADTLLETVPDDATIAHLTFTSADGKSHETFSVSSSEQSRRLRFGRDKPLSFRMDTGWKNFWK